MAENDLPGSQPIDGDVLDFAQTVFGYVRTGHVAAMAPLLQQGLPANLRNQKGDSLLMLASYHRHHEMTELLLEHGADPTLANDRGQVPIGGAAFNGDLRMVQLMLDKGAPVDGTGPDGRTALMLAAMFDRLPVMDLLLARGADPHAQDGQGRNALDLAQSMGAANAVARLQGLIQAEPSA